MKRRDNYTCGGNEHTRQGEQSSRDYLHHNERNSNLSLLLHVTTVGLPYHLEFTNKQGRSKVDVMKYSCNHRVGRSGRSWWERRGKLHFQQNVICAIVTKYSSVKILFTSRAIQKTTPCHPSSLSVWVPVVTRWILADSDGDPIYRSILSETISPAQKEDSS